MKKRNPFREENKKKGVMVYMTDLTYTRLCQKADDLGIGMSPAISIAVNQWLKSEELETYAGDVIKMIQSAGGFDSLLTRLEKQEKKR